MYNCNICFQELEKPNKVVMEEIEHNRKAFQEV